MRKIRHDGEYIWLFDYLWIRCGLMREIRYGCLTIKYYSTNWCRIIATCNLTRKLSNHCTHGVNLNKIGEGNEADGTDFGDWTLIRGAGKFWVLLLAFVSKAVFYNPVWFRVRELISISNGTGSIAGESEKRKSWFRIAKSFHWKLYQT